MNRSAYELRSNILLKRFKIYKIALVSVNYAVQEVTNIRFRGKDKVPPPFFYCVNISKVFVFYLFIHRNNSNHIQYSNMKIVTLNVITVQDDDDQLKSLVKAAQNLQVDILICSSRN